MRRLIPLLLLLSLWATACGSAMPAPAATEAPAEATELPAEPMLETPTPEPPTETALPSPSPVPSSTPSPAPTSTETPLPPLDLPTLAPDLPTLAVWDGLPTYLGDSQPGYYFRVQYDPERWALTVDQFGMPALGHRQIEYCVISPAAGRGLPLNVRVEHDILYVGDVTFDVGMAYVNNALTFATYQGSNGTIFTGFEVNFTDHSETCLADALTVLSTLQAVPISQATPQP